MPHSAEIEKAVLGAALASGEGLYEALPLVSPEDFYLDSHRRLWAQMAELGAQGRPVDLVTLVESFGAAGQLAAIGGAGYIASLTDCALPGSLQSYIRKAREYAKRRAIIAAAHRAELMAQDTTSKPEECLGALQDDLLRISAEGETTSKLVKDFTAETMRELEILSQRTGEVVGLYTGVPELDRSTTGIRPRELWIVGALPGRGKTSLALQMAGVNAANESPVLMFSLEMARNECLKILWAQNSLLLTASKVRDPKFMGQDDWAELARVGSRVAEWPIYIEDRGALHIRQLTSLARLFIRRHGVKLIIVDYLRLVDSPPRETREKLGYVSNALRELAKSEEVAVVGLSQLSRPREINDPPSMLSLKESGDIEAHAHTVLLLYSPIGDDRAPTGEEEIIVGKQRHGVMGSIPVHFNRRHLRFEERAT